MLCEGLMTNPTLTQFAVKVLFEELYVPVVYRVLTNSLPMYASSSVTGLVIDCGYSSTQILPIFEGYPLIKAFQTTPAAGALLHQQFFSVIEGQGVQPNFVNLEDLVVQCKQTRTMFLPHGQLTAEIEAAGEDAESKTYAVRPEGCSREVTITFADRIAPANLLFGSLQNDEPNISASLLTALMKV